MNQSQLVQWSKQSCVPSTSSLELLNRAARYAVRLPGDVVECGTYNGGSARVIADGIGDRKLWMYDAFTGLPPTTPIDGKEAATLVGEMIASPKVVKQRVEEVGCTNYQIVEGYFESSFKAPDLPDKVCMIHIDCDWYESVLLCLRTFYDRVVPGGSEYHAKCCVQPGRNLPIIGCCALSPPDHPWAPTHIQGQAIPD